MAPLVWAGVGACVLAAFLLTAVAIAPARARVDITRLDPRARPAARGWAGVIVESRRVSDLLLRRLGGRQALAGALERAGMQASPAQVLLIAVLGALAGALAGGSSGGPVGAVPLAPLVPLAVVLTLRVRARRRRESFAEQLDDTLRLIASSMRAGHSLNRALEAVAHDAESPTSEEFVRVLNELRAGRDLVEALDEVADRMDSEDLSWVVQAVAIHREVGGNLAEVLDRVGATVRDRAQLRRQARVLSAEGRTSAIVLVALPVVIAGALQVVAPDYMRQLTSNSTGMIMLLLAGLLMLVGAVWVRRVVTVRF